jgi:acetyl-CoA carboxylase beta subunit
MVELLVKCPECGDEFHTLNLLGKGEVCTVCGDYFYIEESDILYNLDN